MPNAQYLVPETTTVLSCFMSWDAETEMETAPLEPNLNARLVEELARLQGLNQVPPDKMSENGLTRFWKRSGAMYASVVPESRRTAEFVLSEVLDLLESYEHLLPLHTLIDHHWTVRRGSLSGDATIGRETSLPVYLDESNPPKIMAPLWSSFVDTGLIRNVLEAWIQVVLRCATYCNYSSKDYTSLRRWTLACTEPQ